MIFRSVKRGIVYLFWSIMPHRKFNQIPPLVVSATGLPVGKFENLEFKNDLVRISYNTPPIWSSSGIREGLCSREVHSLVVKLLIAHILL